MAQTINELVQLGSPALEYNRIESASVRLESSPPEEVLRWAFKEFEDRISIATGFGLEGVALIDLAVKINPHADIFFLDTSFLFPETYLLRRRLEDRYRIEIRGLRTEMTPEAQEQSFGPRLWSTDPDLCCRLRKLEPLREGLSGRAAWMTAIRRDQTAARSASRVVEWDHQWGLVKVNPLVGWSKSDVWSYVRKNDVPYNPLHEQGYPSIGCTHCTRAVREGEDERAGRWSGFAKTECGLHGGKRI
ncbi:MAG TPA: phosphoadenylyl-sulfate reductase [Blastocatellia bacterium]|jgi:phosphoadenosine phosphosulfate reductase